MTVVAYGFVNDDGGVRRVVRLIGASPCFGRAIELIATAGAGALDGVAAVPCGFTNHDGCLRRDAAPVASCGFTNDDGRLRRDERSIGGSPPFGVAIESDDGSNRNNGVARNSFDGGLFWLGDPAREGDIMCRRQPMDGGTEPLLREG